MIRSPPLRAVLRIKWIKSNKSASAGVLAACHLQPAHMWLMHLMKTDSELTVVEPRLCGQIGQRSCCRPGGTPGSSLPNPLPPVLATVLFDTHTWPQQPLSPGCCHRPHSHPCSCARWLCSFCLVTPHGPFFKWRWMCIITHRGPPRASCIAA